jgi:hypothetical protein
MSKFFFHTRDGDIYAEDTQGIELPDLASARQEALLAAREMMSEMLLRNEIVNGQQFEISDTEGKILDIIPFKSAMKTQ